MAILITIGLSIGVVIISQASSNRPAMERTNTSGRRTGTGELGPSGNPAVLLVYARPDGFEPKELQFASGTQRMVIINDSGLDGLSISFGAKEQDPLLSGIIDNTSQLNDLLTLEAGSYVITEQAHPEWECVVTVAE